MWMASRRMSWCCKIESMWPFVHEEFTIKKRAWRRE